MAYSEVPGSNEWFLNGTAAATLTLTKAGETNKRHRLKGIWAKCDTASQAITVTLGGTALPTIRIGNEDVVLIFGDGIPVPAAGAVVVALATGTSVDLCIWGETIPSGAAVATS